MHQPSTGTHPVRATIAALAGSLLTVGLGSAGGGLVAEASAWASPDRWVAVATVCLGAGAAAVLTTGCWLLAASGFASRFPRPALWCGRLGARLTPALLRRAVGLTVGAGIGVTVLGGIAVASEIDLGWEVTSTQRGDADDSAIATSDEADDPAAPDEPTPDEPTHDESAPDEPAHASTAEPSSPIPPETPDRDPDHTDLRGTDHGDTTPEDSAAPAPPPAGTGVTVRSGDSLWRIAARHLGSGASDAEIAATWPLWYQANRTVIGSDPGLIHPGQVLAPPDASVRTQ